jgi:hypothetical protein
MSQERAPDFTKDEIRLIKDTLKERSGHEMELELADADMRLNPARSEKRRYDDLLDCVVSLLCAQADYELKEQGATGMKNKRIQLNTQKITGDYL